MTMNTVQKSRFKPKAFEYFRMVEAGESLIISDHGRPVAKIVPYSGEPDSSIGSLEELVKRYDRPIEETICRRSVEFPDIHTDPADRMILATAVELGCAVVSEDPRFRAYEVATGLC
jgi:prevent-host-death family protein